VTCRPFRPAWKLSGCPESRCTVISDCIKSYRQGVKILTRIALTFGVLTLLAGTANAQVSVASVAPQVLSASDAALYRDIIADEQAGQFTKAQSLSAKLGDPCLQGYAEAEGFLSPKAKRATLAELVAWLKDYRDLAVADRVYRLAVARSTKTVRKGKKRITVAVVTNIPAPSGVGSRSGGYEDAELPEPVPRDAAARAALPVVLADIKAGDPDAASAVLDGVRATATGTDIAILSHRIAASYLAEGLNDKAYALAASVSDPAVPQLLWDSGFAAYRLGQWDNAIRSLEALAQTAAAQNTLRAQGAFWAARAHMQSGDPGKVVTLLAFAAKQNPSFYGILAEHSLGIDTNTGFADAVLSASDFADLMHNDAAHRAVALWQAGLTDYVGTELNRAFVQEDERLDPAMVSLAHTLGVFNVELRASEKSAARGVILTGLFPVPAYAPDGGYRIDNSLVLAFARIESRFQTQATSPVGARGLMQIMPATAKKLGIDEPDTLYDPGVALSAGQKYIEQLLNRAGGNLMEVGGAYNAGPLAVDRWLTTKAGKDDPLLFVESIPVQETRSYVKRLMLYHWLYRRRFGQDADSLDQTARGQWPIYRPAAQTSTASKPVPVAAAAPTALTPVVATATSSGVIQ
jgi:soluble lytic murein transglycosylase